MPRRVFATRGKKIDFKEWVAAPGINLTLTADGTSLGGSVAFAIPATILRCRGEIAISPTSAVVNLDAVRITTALGIVSSDAFAAGAGSVPDPQGEPEYPWLYWKDSVFFYTESSAANAVQSIVGAVRFDVDTKAMRKMKPGESLAWVVQYVDITGAPPMTIQIAATRVLIGT